MPPPCSPCAPMHCAPQWQGCSPSAQMQLQPCNPCTPMQLQTCSPLAPPQVSCSQHATPQLQQTCSVCAHGSPMPQAPPPPELHLDREAGAALMVRWQGMGPSVAGYVVELQESGSTAVERYVRSAPPAATAASIMELCVGGLAPRGCYAAHVRCIAPCG